MLKSGKIKDNSRKKGVAAAKKTARRTEAATRQAAYDKLTVAQKVAKLDTAGLVAKKQRAKLATTK